MGSIDSESMAGEDTAQAETIALAFGASVRALRLQAGISLNELARRTGVDPAYIHRIESRSGGGRCASGRSLSPKGLLPR